MEVTRVVLEGYRTSTLGGRISDCTACGCPIFENRYHIYAYVDGDYYKRLYVVCSEECEKAINEED